jgi:hypothetical protein
MLHTLHFFYSKCDLFHNATIFVSCIICILHTGCAKILMPNFGAKRLNEFTDRSRITNMESAYSAVRTESLYKTKFRVYRFKL